MRKILFILLLFSQFCEGQVTITQVTVGGSFTCPTPPSVPTNVAHNNLALTSGKLYIAVVFSDSSDNYGSNITGTSFTWDTVSQIQSHTRRIAVYRCLPTSSTTTDDPTVTFGISHWPNMIDFSIYEITGMTLGLNGANAVTQVAHDSATSANPSISTMTSIVSNSSVLAFFTNNTSSFSGTPESGWTEDIDNGCAGGGVRVAGIYTMHRINTSDNTPTVTRGSSDWIGTAIALSPSSRRIIITN